MGCSPPCSGAYPARRTAQGIKRLHCQSAGMSLDGPHGRPSGGASLRAWTTTSRLPRIAGHGRGVGAQAPPRRSPAPAHPVFLHLPGTTGGRDGHSRTDGRTPTRTPARTAVQDGHLGLACWTARADTKADGHRDRPHAGRVPLVVCSRPSVRVGRGVRITNDSSPPWAAVRPGVRVWCPAVQGGSVHPDRHGARDGQAPGPTVALTALRASSLAA
jgi:hypothetical protein